MKRVFTLIALILALAVSSHAQGVAIGNAASTLIGNTGRPIAGAGVAICAPVATTAASVTSNVATITLTGNAITQGFAQGATVMVSGFTGGDTYFNGGSLTSGQIVNGFTLLSVTSTTITFALVHANASTSSNGVVLQEGNTTTPCAGLSTVYTDPGELTVTANPFATDGLGNWQAFGTAGTYFVQFYGPQIVTTIKTITGGVPTNPLIITSLTTAKIDNIIYVDGSVYPTLASALAALPATGGTIVDCFPETFNADPFAAVTKPFHINLCANVSQVLGAGWFTNVPIRFNHNGQVLQGAGPNSTLISAGPSFPINSYIFSMGQPFPGIYGTQILELAITCGLAPVVGCGAINMDGIEETSGVEDINAVACTTTTGCFRVSSDQGGGATENPRTFNNIRATMWTGTNQSCVGPVIDIAASTGFRIELHNGTETGVLSGCSTPAGILVESPVDVDLSVFHAEDVVDVVRTNSTAIVTARDIIGHSTDTNVYTSTAAGGNYTLLNLQPNGITGNTINDTGNGMTVPSTASVNFCARAGVTALFLICPNANRGWFATPPTGASPGFQMKLSSGFTGSTPALLVQHSNGTDQQVNLTGDGRIAFRGNQAGAFTQTLQSDVLTASRTVQYPNGTSATVMVAALVTTAAATDNVTIQGMASGGHCTLTPTNAAAATNIATTYISAKAANQITVSHAATANMNYDIACTSN
jgi:hypothetical protein